MNADHFEASPLALRVDALREAAEHCRGRLPTSDVDAALTTVDKTVGRLRHGTALTVVAVAGATGSGKSSLVNSVAGRTVSDVGVRRPTTSTTVSLVWGGHDAGALLDWLGIAQRHTVDDGDPSLGGLVLLDLPDHDSTAVDHRLEVDRLVELVDVLVWVTDPQKYADEALHAGYIEPLAGHARVLRFVLNQVDRLDDGGDAIASDLVRLLRDDGIDGPHVIQTSTTTGVGIGQVTAMLADSVSERRAAVDRLDVDLRSAAATLTRTGTPADTRSRHRDLLVEDLAEAAGARGIAEIASAHHRRQGGLAMGWPFTRFVRRLARRPLADLPGPGRDGASEPRVDLAVRDYSEVVAEEMEKPWPALVRAEAMSERTELLDELRATTGTAAVDAGRPAWWWQPVAWLQRVTAAAAVIGLVWLLVVALLGGFFRFDTDPLLPETPGIDWAPLPSSLLIVGALLGLVIGALARIPLRLAAARRGHRARRAVEARVEDVADRRVVEPVDRILAEQRRIDELLRIAMG